jgi:hypothetical protein
MHMAGVAQATPAIRVFAHLLFESNRYVLIVVIDAVTRRSA